VKKEDMFNNKFQNTDLKKQSLHGGAVTLTSQGLMFFIQLGSTMVLARILKPQDYGMMAMVVAVTGLAGVLSNLGLSTATIQRADINHAQVSTLFWINTGVGALVTLAVAVLSPVVAWFYQTPELVWMTLALSSNFFINGLAVQHSALLNRQMRFYSLAKIQVFSTLMGIGTAIVAAKYGLGYWALVLNSLVTSATSVFGTWVASGWVPGRPCFSADVKSMVKFGADIVGFNVINYFARNLDNVLIGRYSGSAALGLYSKAYQLLMMPITNLRDPMTKVAMPALSRLQHEPEQYRNYYMKYISILAFVSMPLVVFMFVCSDQLIRLLLGPQWLGASDLFKILAIAAFIQPVSTTWGLVLLSTGKSKRYLRWGLVNSVIVVTAFMVGIPWGAKGVAVTYSISTYALLYPTLLYAFMGTPIKISDFIFAVWKPIFGCVGIWCVCSILLRNIGGLADIIVLIISFCVSFVIYFFCLIVVSGGLSDLREYYSYGRLIFSKK